MPVYPDIYSGMNLKKYEKCMRDEKLNKKSKNEDKTLKIKIEITSKSGTTIINRGNFNDAIIDLINEREWDNYAKKEDFKRKLKKHKVYK